MAEMFVKIFSQILDSSIADNPRVRHLFMDLLVMCDDTGIVDMTPTAIAARTRLPLAEVRKCLEVLEAADPQSRTPTEDGRRIARLSPDRDWGWRIINYRLYRETATKEALREAARITKRQQRARSAGRVGQAAPSPQSPFPSQRKNADPEVEGEGSGTCPGHVPDMRAPQDQQGFAGASGRTVDPVRDAEHQVAGEEPASIAVGSGGGDGAEIPSLQEVVEYAGMRGIPAEYAKHYCDQQEIRNQWLVGPTRRPRVRGWKTEICKWWAADHENWARRQGRGSAVAPPDHSKGFFA